MWGLSFYKTFFVKIYLNNFLYELILLYIRLFEQDSVYNRGHFGHYIHEIKIFL